MRLLFVISLVLLVSCKKPLPDQDVLAKEFYDRKVAELYREIDDKCRSEAYRNAELHVDNLVDQWINSTIQDTVNFPPKPLKPVRPEPIMGTVEKFDLDSLR